MPSDCFPSGERRLFILNSLSQSLSTINLDTLETCIHSGELDQSPNDLCHITPHLWVVNSLGNSIQILDDATASEITRIDTGKGGNPYSLYDNGQGHVFVSLWLKDKVLVVSTKTFAIEKEIPLLPGLSTDLLPLSPQDINGTKDVIGVSCVRLNRSNLTYGDGEIQLIHPLNYEIIRQIGTGKNPQFLFFVEDTVVVNEVVEDRKDMHVVCTGIQEGDFADDGIVQIFNAQTWELKHTITIGGSPGDYAIDTQNQTVYLAGIGGLIAYRYDTYEVLYDANHPISLSYSSGQPTNDFFSSVEIEPAQGWLIATTFTSNQAIIRPLQSLHHEWKRINLGDGPIQMLYVNDESN